MSSTDSPEQARSARGGPAEPGGSSVARAARRDLEAVDVADPAHLDAAAPGRTALVTVLAGGRQRRWRQTR